MLTATIIMARNEAMLILKGIKPGQIHDVKQLAGSGAKF